MAMHHTAPGTWNFNGDLKGLVPFSAFAYFTDSLANLASPIVWATTTPNCVYIGRSHPLPSPNFHSTSSNIPWPLLPLMVMCTLSSMIPWPSELTSWNAPSRFDLIHLSLLVPAARPYTLGQLAAEMFNPSSNEEDCLQLKRGEDIIGSTSPHLLVQHFQELLLMFGFNWHMERQRQNLACLQSCKLINAVIMPYNNALLFGMTHVVCRFEDMQVYSSEAIEDCASLEWGLVHYGFGRTLFQATITLQFVEFMEFVTKWHNDVCEILRMDPQHLLGHRYHELAHIIKEECVEFPNPAILAILIDASVGAATCVLLQFLGNVNGEGLQCGLQVISHFDKPLPTYRLSVLSWPLAMPVDMDWSPVMHMSPLSEDANGEAFYEIEVPVVMLEYSRPDLVHDLVHASSQSSHVQLVDEDAGHQPFESIVNLVALSPDAGVIDLTDGKETQTGIVRSHDLGQCMQEHLEDNTNSQLHNSSLELQVKPDKEYTHLILDHHKVLEDVISISQAPSGGDKDDDGQGTGSIKMKEQVLETNSVNLEVVMCIPGVNFTHVYYNSCVEIFNMLGIEATHTETVEILMEAAAVGGKDDCHSIAENVIFSQLVPMGTGAFYVTLDIDVLNDTITDYHFPVQDLLAAHMVGSMTPGQVAMTPYDMNSPAWSEHNFKGKSATFSLLTVNSRQLFIPQDIPILQQKQEGYIINILPNITALNLTSHHVAASAPVPPVHSTTSPQWSPSSPA
ncbi:hypothetical protein F5J12DRAFT_784134 [Pisolithus orientalis]|uniref:uncharacterized protein n=1 Tax=Pisolithus orientalis TaxID=936130 RepID=UPI00222533E2|nr:uncharacterized protein F5J12DRAFT_784134 [Pisolithus orientalis]KAI6001617.1 hypothetical protein F5J12DRAFT_784134 [Pisolithus orientalis]